MDYYFRRPRRNLIHPKDWEDLKFLFDCGIEFTEDLEFLFDCESEFTEDREFFYDCQSEFPNLELFYDCRSEFPLIENLRTLVEIDVMEEDKRDKLEDLQSLLQRTRTAVNNSYALACEMSFCRWSYLDDRELKIVTERLDNCRQDLAKLPLDELQMFTAADLDLAGTLASLPPSSSAHQVLHMCRRALRVKAQSDQQLLQLLPQPDWEAPRSITLC